MKKYTYFVSYSYTQNNPQESGFGMMEVLSFKINSWDRVTEIVQAIKDKFGFSLVTILNFQLLSATEAQDDNY